VARLMGFTVQAISLPIQIIKPQLKASADLVLFTPPSSVAAGLGYKAPG